MLRRVLAASSRQRSPAKRTHHQLRPLWCRAPLKGISTPYPGPHPPPPSQSGVDIACTNSTTTERQSRRPKALATYLGSPHAAFVVRVSSMLLAGWLASWLDGWLQLAAAG